MRALTQDLKYAARTLLRNRGFLVAAVATMALGIGANTAVFAVVQGVLLRPLPFGEPDRLVAVSANGFLGNREVVYLRDHARTLQSVASLSPGWGYALGGGARPTQVQAGRTSANLFEMLGASATVGRTFLPHEGQPGNHAVALLSNALWTQQFGADPEVVGRTITLSGQPYDVVGVMPPDFSVRGTPQHDVWIPLPMDPAAWYHSAGILQIVARLGDGSSLDAANSELAQLAPRMRTEFGEAEDYVTQFDAQSLAELTVGDVQSTLLLVAGAAGFILLIAGANLGGLLLARSTDRGGEITVRMSLGASRGRVVRQLLTESALLAALGGLAGLAVAYLAVPALVALLPPSIPRLHEIGVDGPVLAVCMLASIVTGFLFGLTPALAATRGSFADQLRASGSGRTVGRSAGARSTLVIGQVGLSLVLMIGAGLMVRTLVNLNNVDPGFRTTGILTLKLQIPGASGSRALFEEIERDVAALPGVTHAATTQHFPIKEATWTSRIEVEGRPIVEGQALPRSTWRSVSSSFFGALDIPLVAGRTFDSNDNADAPEVVVINETLAEALFPDGDVVNQRIRALLGEPDSMATVIGVVGDVRTVSLRRDGGPVMYRPALQVPMAARTLVVRTDVEPLSLVRAVRERTWAVDAEIPISEVATVRQVLSQSMAQPRVVTVLLALFAGIGVALGTIGLYGVVAYTVGRRTREIGIRVALGAQRGDVARLILGNGLGLAAVGVVLGLGASFALTRLLADQLFDVGTVDLPTFVLVAALLLGITALASYLPARRAARLNAVDALDA